MNTMCENMKLKKLKKAVRDYRKFNQGGIFSPEYGILMFDKSDGELWTDYFYSIGHNEWKVYHSDDIVYLSNMMEERGIDVTAENVEQFILENFYQENS